MQIAPYLLPLPYPALSVKNIGDCPQITPVDGRASGYEGLLAEQFHFLLAAITGYLGCELTMDGLVINGPDTERVRSLKPDFARLAGHSSASGSDGT